MRFFRSNRVLVFILFAGLFYPMTFLPTLYLFDLVNALTVAVGLGVLIAYGPGLIRSFRDYPWAGSHYLVAGITFTWFANVGRHMWNWAWRVAGKPPEMIDHWLVAFLVWIAFLGGLGHLAAKGAIEDDIPRANWIRVGVYVAAGAAVGLSAIVFMDHSAFDVGDLFDMNAGPQRPMQPWTPNLDELKPTNQIPGQPLWP